LDVFCWEEPKSEGLVPSRPPDFAGMMRPGHNQSTSFGGVLIGVVVSALCADFEPQARRYNPECSRPRLQQRAAARGLVNNPAHSGLGMLLRPGRAHPGQFLASLR